MCLHPTKWENESVGIGASHLPQDWERNNEPLACRDSPRECPGERKSIMAKDLRLIASIYPDQEHANTILETLQRMHRASNITLVDAALVTKDEDGKVHIDETKEVTTAKGAKRGAIIAGVFGLIYPPSLIVTVLAGGGIGGLWGKLRDTGIKTGDMKVIADDLQPGSVALIVVAEPPSVPSIERAMEGWDGRIVRHGFSEEESDLIEQAADEAAKAMPPVELAPSTTSEDSTATAVNEAGNQSSAPQ
jgi:uncharacterized membrane protein